MSWRPRCPRGCAADTLRSGTPPGCTFCRRARASPAPCLILLVAAAAARLYNVLCVSGTAALPLCGTLAQLRTQMWAITV